MEYFLKSHIPVVHTYMHKCCTLKWLCCILIMKHTRNAFFTQTTVVIDDALLNETYCVNTVYFANSEWDSNPLLSSKQESHTLGEICMLSLRLNLLSKFGIRIVYATGLRILRDADCYQHVVYTRKSDRHNVQLLNRFKPGPRSI